MRHIRAARLAALGLVLLQCSAAAQVVVQGRAQIGRIEYRVRDDGLLQPSSGTALGAGFGLLIRERFEVWGEALGGKLNAEAPTSEDRNVAQVQILGGATVRPWLTAQAGATVRSYWTSVARQRWTMLRLGAEAHIPLALEGLAGFVRGHWMPAVSVSGIAGPALALAAATGVEWRTRRVSIGAVYALERYDFPDAAGGRRLEELSSLELRTAVRLRK